MDMNINMNVTQHPLFSIDTEAHLKKAASHTFGSPSHYPVELVRAALRRGAQEVDIHIMRDRIQVRDNGSGLDVAAVETLTCLMDPARASAVKEAAVQTLQTREGMGLLAIFAPNPEEILVENVSESSPGKNRVHFRKDRFKRSESCSLTTGTLITLVTKQRDYAREKRVLQAFCQSVPRDIRLNNTPIGGQPLLPHPMASMKLSPSKYASGGQIGIPQTGTLCHLRLLDQAIPWHHFTLPPQRGFIFDAAVEYTGEITNNFITHLLRYVLRLYRWLCRQYASASPHQQTRIEELLFTHCRSTGDVFLVHQFSPFKGHNSPYSLNLRQLMQKAASGSLYAVPGRKESLHYNTAGKTVLSLTREQADLLVNHLDLPVHFLSPIRRRTNRLHHFCYTLAKIFRRFILKLLPTSQKPLKAAQLSSAEQLFLRTINRYLSSHPDIFSSSWVQAAMVASRWPFPSIPLKIPKRGEKEKTSLQWFLIRRDHHLVRKAVRAVQRDPGNVEIFVPLLIR